VSPIDVLPDDLALTLQGKITHYTPVAEYVECRASLRVDETCPLDDRIRDRPCETAEVADSPCERVGIVRGDVARDPAIEGRPEVYGYAWIPEIDRCPLGTLFYSRHREFPLHLVRDHLNTSAPNWWDDTGDGSHEDDLVGIAVWLEFGSLVRLRHGRCHLPWRHTGHEAAIGKGEDELSHLVR